MVSFETYVGSFPGFARPGPDGGFLQAYAHWAEGPIGSQRLLEDWQSTGRTSPAKLAEMARKLAKAVWPQRQALRRWLREGDGARPNGMGF